jgi:ribosomal protein L37AE/L43A
MTKYFETISRGKTPQNDKVVIDVDEYGEDPVREWICPWCSTIIQARKSRREIDCRNCNATVDLGAGPNKAQETKTIVDPNKSRDIEPCVVSIDYNPNDMVSHTGKKPTPKGSFAAMQKKGIRITNYNETDCAGRPLTE